MSRKQQSDETEQQPTAEQGIAWAVEQLTNGERVMRADWPARNGNYLTYLIGSPYVTITTATGDDSWKPHPEDLVATDWQLYTEPAEATAV